MEVIRREALCRLTQAWLASGKCQVCATGTFTKQDTRNALPYLTCPNERTTLQILQEVMGGARPSCLPLQCSQKQSIAERLVWAGCLTENVTFLPVTIWRQTEGAVFQPGFLGRGGEGH